MGNTFVVLPPPLASGPGAEVDVSALGADKTITVKCTDAVLIEYSNDDAHLLWSPVVSFVSSGVKTVQLACRYLRITIKDFVSGVAFVSVGAVAAAVAFDELIAPAVSGDGAPVDTSGLPGFKTIQVTGAFTGVCNIEISNDGDSYEAVASFRVGESPTWSGIAYAKAMRVRRTGVNLKTPGPVPIIDIAAVAGASINTDASMHGDGSVGDPAGTNPWGLDTTANSFIGSADLRRMTRVADDLFGVVQGTQVGTGAISNSGDTDTNREFGAWLLACNATGDIASVSPFAPNTGTTNIGVIQVANCDIVGCDIRWRSELVQDVGREVVVAVGFVKDLSLGSDTGGNIQGGAFLANPTLLGNNNWWAFVRGDDATETMVDTGVDISDHLDEPARFTVLWDRTTETWTFYIDGTLVGTVATPGFSGAQCASAVTMNLVDGTSGGAGAFVDWIDTVAQTTTPR